MQLVPSWRHELRLGRRKEGLVRYRHSEGMPFLPEFNGGLCFPQVYCKAVANEGKQIYFTDDVIFSQRKKGLFQLLIVAKDIKEAFSAGESMANIGEISNGEMTPDETTLLVEDINCGTDDNPGDIMRIATEEEFSNSPLCEKRPIPEFYDPFIIGKVLKGAKFIILRPDRFIFAACETHSDLESAVRRATSYIQT